MIVRNNVIPYRNEVRLSSGEVLSIDKVKLNLKMKKDCNVMNDLSSVCDLSGREHNMSDSLISFVKRCKLTMDLLLCHSVTYDYFSKNGCNQYQHYFVFRTYEKEMFSFAMNYVDYSGTPHFEKATLEFNPNKVSNPLLLFMIDFILFNAWSSEVKRYDFAVDIPINRQYAFLNRVNGVNYKYFVSDSVTEYLGQRNNDGHVKLYDKGAELKLPIDMTRLEVTCESFSRDILNSYLSKCYFLGVGTLLDELSETDRAILELLFISGSPSKYLNRMSRKKRDVLGKYLSGVQSFQVSFGDYYAVIDSIKRFDFDNGRYVCNAK